MADPRLARKLEEGLSQLPILDVHTHLVGGRLGARGLHDIILYHMAVSDLYSAGCPSGARLSQYPDFPSIEEAHSRIREALPYLHHTRNTSTSWGARIILRDLYGVTEPIGPDNWERVDSLIGERSEDRAWHREIIGRAGIARLGTELARRERGQDDDVLQYSLEWAFFTRCQWGEFDTALYELERCWGKTAGPPAPIGAEERLPAERAISSLDDVHAAVEWYVDAIPADRILALATHISTDIDLGPVGDAEMAAALAARASAGPKERSIYASYVNEAFLNSLEAKYGNRLVLQFSLGAEPLPFETGSRLSQGSIAQLAEMIGRHPGLQFQCFLAARHANQALCTLCCAASCRISPWPATGGTTSSPR